MSEPSWRCREPRTFACRGPTPTLSPRPCTENTACQLGAWTLGRQRGALSTRCRPSFRLLCVQLRGDAFILVPPINTANSECAPGPSCETSGHSLLGKHLPGTPACGSDVSWARLWKGTPGQNPFVMPHSPDCFLIWGLINEIQHGVEFS